jgi:DNA-directed RNA polymerase subunit M/transcription elongation factor TFIIS
MEFCPKCDTALVPKRIGRSWRITCPRCGYKDKIKNPSSYKIVEKGKEWREVVVITKNDGRRKSVEREYELEPPEYEAPEHDEG